MVSEADRSTTPHKMLGGAMRRTSSYEDMVPDMRDRLRSVLTKANQELLRELAMQSAAQSQGAAGVPIERIMEDVADKVLADVPFLHQSLASTSLVASVGKDEEDAGFLPEKKPLEPQLTDIKAVPWSVWSDSELMQADASLDPEQTPGSEQRSFLHRPSRNAWRSPTRQAAQEPSFGNVPVDSHVMTAGLRMLPTTRQNTLMSWTERPKTVMLVAKQGDKQVTLALRDIASWLDSQKVTIVIEPDLLAEIECPERPRRNSNNSDGSCGCDTPHCDCERLERHTSDPVRKWGWGNNDGLPLGFVSRLRTWTPNVEELERRIDLLVCLGGDGTLCWAAGLFPEAMPPVIAFAGGSLGFLTPFSISEWMASLMPLIIATKSEAPRVLSLTCRMRFQMRVRRASKKKDDQTEAPMVPLQALNEVLLHRGSNPNLVKLDVSVGNTPITLVQGDGLILATPTGSTAYSMAAGGSMVHPSVPGIILTPVCPHSLSFRPVVLPDSAIVNIQIPKGSRTCQVMVAVDGKEVIELNWGDSLEVSVSPFPLPTLCKDSETDDWFRSVNTSLRWNLRREQKGLGQ
mmetsp:Transcript_75109/g.178526  ORF Transcript_75109/g.178526 Transcript_75109/m.178526 type:complete len:574 (+) Transcript_75109:76-1797(+)